MLLSSIFIFITSFSQASELSLRTTLHEDRSNISASYESSSFTVDDGKITGTGVRLAFYNALSENFGAELGISAAVNTAGAVQNSFTGFSGYGYYNLLGRQFNSVKRTYLGDALISSESEPSTHSLLVGAGISQYFLNGNKGVYSASGIGLGIIYKFRVWGINFKLSSRWNQLEAAQTSVSALTYDAGILFNL